MKKIPVVNMHPTTWAQLHQDLPHVSIDALRRRYRDAQRMYGEYAVMQHHLDHKHGLYAEQNDLGVAYMGVFEGMYLKYVCQNLKH